MRCLYRNAAIPEPDADRSLALADRILADPSLAPVHAMTEALLSRYEIRTRNPAYFNRAAQRLASSRQDDGLRDDLYAHTTIWDRFVTDEWTARGRLNPGVAASLHAPDLTYWILNMQCLESSCGDYSYRRWKRTGTLPWLTAALANANSNTGYARELIEAGASVPETSPAYETVSFHRLRLLIELGGSSQARDTLDRLLADPKLPKSSANAFRALRMRAAPDVEDFLRFALRPPVMITWTMNEGEVPVDWPEPKGYSLGDLRFDRDSVKILNERTPLRLLAGAALGDNLPVSVRRDFVLTTFTRAVLLDDRETAARLAGRLGEVAPELQEGAKPACRQGVANDREFTAAFLLLHTPEARPYYASGVGRQAKPGKIENYRDNWWCPVSVKWDLDALANVDLPLVGHEPPYRFGRGGARRRVSG